MSTASPRPAFQLARVVAVAGFLSVARGTLIAAAQGFVARGPVSLGLSIAADHVIGGFVLVLASALLARLVVVRRPRAAAGVFVAGAVLAYLFLSLAWPSFALERPDFQGPRSLAAHAVAAVGACAAAFWITRTPVSPLGSRSTRLQHGVVLASVATLVGALGLRAYDRFARRATPERPNVILISLDSVRADHLSCAGYPRGTTPNLDRFARESVRFERAYTPEPATLAAHASLLTGVTPDVHGADALHAIDTGVRTLAEDMTAAGLDTWAQVGDTPWLSTKFGLARGFATWRALPGGAEASLDALEPALDALSDRRFFLFLHLDDAAADARRFAYDHDFEDGIVCVPNESIQFAGCDEVGNCGARYLFARNAEGAVPPPAPILRHLEGRYDAGLRSLDRRLGRILDELRARGLLERSVVVVTSDHGQGFGERARYLHASVGPEATRVPLLVRPPGGVPEHSSPVPVSTVDVAACLREYAAGTRAAERGSSLGRILSGRGEGDEWVVSRYQGDVALRSRTASIVFRRGGHEVFDARVDPMELEAIEGVGAEPDAWETLPSSPGRVSTESLARGLELGARVLSTNPVRGPGVSGFDEVTWRRLLWLGEPPESVAR